MEVGTIRHINIDAEMQASYLDYAMSVIVSRALPDVRDGLKPVHRRILYAMHDLGLANDKPYKKSARIVGEVLGKYHPHGDAAVYEAMVRMAQDFSLRYPLVDGQGNFGSIDGDNAAAMRYTEARLARIANEMLADIDKDTVDWTDNFDGTLREPTVLPAALPNLVVNGASGIAVGMATNIPPHNLGEVCDALCFLIDNYHRAEDISTDDLMRFIQGPDFPTGGIVFRYEHEGNGADAEQVDAIEKAYGSGRGSLVVQARAHIEEMSRSRSRIVVTELPYQTDKSRLLERIAELVRDGRIDGITDLRDESDRTGMRICIELTRTVDTRRVLADLYKLTPLQSTFGVSLLALVDGEPRLLSLKRMLLHFLEHRQVVIVRRARHDLAQARQRAHILEGLLRALDVLDEIIALIRGSRNAEAARLELKRRFEFTEVQAQAILDMQLRRLAALERQRLADEYKQVLKHIKDLEALLGSPKKVLALIRENLTDLKTTYADPRRTQIADRAKAVLTAREHAVERDVWIAIDADGKLATHPRGGDGPRATGSEALPKILRTPGKAPRLLLPGNTRQDLYLFSASGRAARVQGHQWPEGPASLSDLAGLKDTVIAMLALSPDEGEERPEGFVLLGTVQGKVKRVNLADLRQATGQPNATPQVVGLDGGDLVAWADSSQGEGEVFLFTADGQAIRFAEEDVRTMGLPAGGIGGIKLREGDRVVSGFVFGRRPGGPNGDGSARSTVLQARPQPTGVAIVTGNGYIKQVEVADFPAQGRFGVGVMAASLSSKSGSVVGAALLGANDLLVCIGAAKATQFLLGCDIPVSARATQGRPIVLKGEQVARVYSVVQFDSGLSGPDTSGDSNAPGPGPGRGRRTGPARPKAVSGPTSAPKTGSGGPAPSKSSRTKPAALQPASEVPPPPAGLAAPAADQAAAPSAKRVTRRQTSVGKSAPAETQPTSTPKAVGVSPAPSKSSRAKPAALQPVPEVPPPPAGLTAPAADQAATPSAKGVTRRQTAVGKSAPAKVQPTSAVPRGSAEVNRAAAKPAPTAQTKSSAETRRGRPASKPAVVEQTPTKVTFDRQTLEKSVDLKKSPAPSRRKAATAQQLPLVPEAPGPVGRGKSAVGSQPGGEVPAPPAKTSRRSQASGTAGAGEEVPATPGGVKKAATAAPKTAAAHADAAKTTSRGARPPATGQPAAAKGKASETPATSSRPKRPAADGPMTWPLVPAPDEDDETDAGPPSPRSPLSRPGV